MIGSTGKSRFKRPSQVFKDLYLSIVRTIYIEAKSFNDELLIDPQPEQDSEGAWEIFPLLTIE